MKISVLIQGSPHATQACVHALRFAQVAIKNHLLYRVFFYKDATLIATPKFTIPNDEWNVQQAWRTFANDHRFRLAVCVGAAQRRGIRDIDPSDEFELVGLGQFVEAVVESDRVVTFN